LLAAISNRIVQIQREHYGRGPMKAKTYALDDIVERELYRKVIAFMSQNHIDRDLAVEVFVLEPADAV
jgi:uncharacterized protein YbcI